jgi:hypothetical protein
MDPRIPLKNTQHEKFARNIALLNMTNAKAYKEAGYTAKQGSNISAGASSLRRRIDVQNRIIILSELAIEGDLQTREWVTSQLKEVVDRCMQKHPIIEKNKKAQACSECGGHRGEWRFDARGTNTALQLMGKDLGMFVEQVKIIDDELANKSPAELKEIIMAAAIDLGRDFVRQLGEAVGLFESDSKATGKSEESSPEPVSTVH